MGQHQSPIEPGSSGLPFARDGRARERHDRSDFLLREPAKVTKLHDLRLARIQARAADTFGRDKARLWLLRPCEPLDNRPPLALLASESGARAVETLLGRIDHGIAA